MTLLSEPGVLDSVAATTPDNGAPSTAAVFTSVNSRASAPGGCALRRIDPTKPYAGEISRAPIAVAQQWALSCR